MSDEIRTSEIRLGNITSSEIAALVSDGTKAGTYGKPFYTYVEECNFERRLKLPLEKEVSTFDMAWGSLCEKFVFRILGISYTYGANITLSHPIIEAWKGSPDFHDEESSAVADAKCPGTRKSFCQMVDCIYIPGTVAVDPDGLAIMERIRAKHPSGKKYYWQLVSNAIITGSKYAELIVFMPYKSQLNEIRELAGNWDGPDQWQFKNIYNSMDESLPYLLDDEFYKNLNVIKFEVPQVDIDLLTERVMAATKLLSV